ncbi:MAG: AtpZ/AtpI family protein [Anaerolineae bacterium]|nr:AtpZ/AtpI family protein [Anaerolineae bacterium]
MKRLGQIVGLATELGMGMGLTAASLVILGLVAGRWLDDRLGTDPVASILLILAGAIAGQLAIYRLAMRSSRALSSEGRHGAIAQETLSALGFALRLLGLMVAPTLIGLGAGLALDARLATGGLALLILALSGFGVGLYGAFRLVRSRRT